MYKVLKDKGNNSNITLENTDTKATIIIGRLTMEILDILTKEGCVFNSDGSEGAYKLKDEWQIEISTEAGKELASKAMRMKKPVRVQKKSEQVTEKKNNKQIDAMDVLLGLANYN